jgi:hypothetical protein
VRLAQALWAKLAKWLCALSLFSSFKSRFPNVYGKGRGCDFDSIHSLYSFNRSHLLQLGLSQLTLIVSRLFTFAVHP